MLQHLDHEALMKKEAEEKEEARRKGLVGLSKAAATSFTFTDTDLNEHAAFDFFSLKKKKTNFKTFKMIVV